MNFLSHYHFYKKDNAYYNFGLVLPDLLKSFCKTHYKSEEKYVSPFYRNIAEGAKMHLEADVKFHNSTFFKNTCDLIASKIDSEAGWPRKWFLNHLLCEILIDRALMDNDENLCEAFYKELETVNKNQISSFLQVSAIPNYQNFVPGLERFIQYRFIFEYQHNENIIMALNRVYNRVGIKYLWTNQDKTLLASQMPDILSYINTNIHLLEAELK